jgi:hypothetical protein
MTDTPCAYPLSDLWENGPFGRTKVYQDIRDGKLHVKKWGRRSIVTPEERRRYVDSLPSISDVKQGCGPVASTGATSKSRPSQAIELAEAQQDSAGKNRAPSKAGA